MNSTQITDLLLVIQAAIVLLIAIRAFYLYFQTRSAILFTLGLSMGVIAIGGIAGLIGDILLKGSFNTFWFRYIGQTVSYFFIFLSILIVGRSAKNVRDLRSWHLFATALLLILLLMTPLIPVNPGVMITELLSGSRSVVCLAIFFSYFAIFCSKETRFSFLMALAFLLISVGIAVYTAKFSEHNPLLLDYVGDSTRIAGLVILLLAFFVG